MVYKCVFILLILTSLVILSSQFGHKFGSEPSACTQCMNNRTCVPPDCFCCRDEFKLPISVKDIPQIVFFTFDDALTDSATKFYHRLFNSSRKNPNGCPVSMTLFVSHHDTVYTNVNQMYRRGMEIAAHSVSHAHMSNKNFRKEARNQRKNLAKLGGVPENEIVGWRSPFLEPVGDMQPDTLKKLGYSYDATLTFSKRSLKDKAPTPFTLDFGWPYDCKVKPCPKSRHFGFWEVPVVSLLDYLHKYDCVYVDGCNNPPPDESAAFNFLMDNFNSYHSRQRVPFGINMHPSWFYIPERLNAMDRFIKTLSKMDDVFIVSVKKMIDWLKNPTGLSQINTFKPWQCENQEPSSGSRVSHEQQKPRQSSHKNQNIDAITRRKNYIRARLNKIQEMRKQSHRFRDRQLSGHHQSHSERKKWWVNAPAKHEHKKQEKPAPIAPWVHRKHDRPVKQNARKPSIVTTPIPGQVSAAEVPFWKRKSKTNVPTIKRNHNVAWWEKAIPQTNKATKIVAPKQDGQDQKPEQSLIVPKPEKTPRRNVFMHRKVIAEKSELPVIQKISRKQPKVVIQSNVPSDVDFKKQLKQQELKQLEIIANQRKRQEQQLQHQIEQLKKNNQKVLKRQEAQEAKRMMEIEQKQTLSIAQQKSSNPETEKIVEFKPPAQRAMFTTMSETFDKAVKTTSAPEKEQFSLFSEKKSKLDPWTRFVQFILKNKP